MRVINFEQFAHRLRRPRCTETYEYDAFGNEKVRDNYDFTPFCYCGEYYDIETGTYYLRARYYDPALGRFTQPDSHWNSTNRIYGDNPQKINEREDVLGTTLYSYRPQISAIIQSGNLYVYAINNPNTYMDSTGKSITVAVLVGIGASTLLGGVVGGINNASKGNGFWNGFVGGCINGFIQSSAIAATGPVGAIWGGALGGFFGNMGTGLLNGNKDNFAELFFESLESAVAGAATGVVTAGVGKAVATADEVASVARQLMQYDEEFGKMVSYFFGTIDDAISYILTYGEENELIKEK